MIYFNNQEKLDKLKITKDNFYVVADFDRTITSGNSTSTWGVMANVKNVDKTYAERRKALFQHYRPIEIDSTISDDEKSIQMENWWNAHISLFFEYQLEEETFHCAIEEGKLQYREGAKTFLKTMNEYHIPVIIVSAGIGNVIEQFLKKNNDYYSNIKIISNFIEFENGKIKSFTAEPIHALNKNIVQLDNKAKETIKNKEYILLLGDGLADLKMIPENQLENAITIGFLEDNIEENLSYFNEKFDIVLSHNESFQRVLEILNIGGIE